MKSSIATGGLKTAALISISAIAVYATGCSSSKSHQAKNQSTTAPIVSSEGHPAAETGEAGGTGANAQTSSSEVVIPLQKEQLNVATEQFNDGGVRIRKQVKTETVNAPVEIRRETVSVERVPAQQGQQQQSSQANTPANLNTPFQEGETTINLTQERPIAQTQTVPAGSVVVRKQVTTQPQTIQRQVRSEEVSAVPIGNSTGLTISGDLKGSESAGGTPEASGAPASASEQSGGAGAGGGEITDLNQLSSSSKPTTLAGNRIHLSDVQVQQVLGDRLLAVGPDTKRPIYVESAKPLTDITPGQTVSLKGTVKAVPSDTTSLGLDPQSAMALQGKGIMINATEVKPHKQ